MGIFDYIHNIFSPPNPAKKAMPYFQQAQQQLPQYFNPFIQAGQQAQPQLQQAYGRMLDPNKFLQDIGGGYHASPGYNWQLQQGLGAANNAAAAGGMLGSPMHQQQAAGMAEGLANQDFYNYLSHALGTYGQGVAGEQGLYSSGQEASTGLGENLSSLMQQQGGLAFQGQQQQNQSQGDIMGMLAKLGFAGAGYATGGPAGAYLAGSAVGGGA